jgi:hypothetical protein
MAIMDEWDKETSELEMQLAQMRRARDSAQSGSYLYQRHQDEADGVNYRWTAYRVARPVLIGLYEQWGKANQEADQYRQGAHDDSSLWAKLGALSGILGSLALIVAAKLSVPWWVGITGAALLVGCVLALLTALTAFNAEPDTRASSALAVRIGTIERAVRACWTVDDLAEVERLLEPRKPGNYSNSRDVVRLQ